MDQRFLVETLEQKPELFRAMLEFNRTLAPLTPEAGNPPVWKALCADAAFSEALRRRMPSAPGFWDFEEESARLALLPEVLLHTLGLCFSAAVHAEAISAVVLRPQVLALRSILGKDVCSYALRRGRYQIGSLRTQLLGLAQGESLPERILSLAAISLSLVAADWPARLPALCPAIREVQLSAPVPREQRRAVWFTMKKILLREVAPQWAPCFN